MNRFDPQIIHYDSLSSTNSEAARLAASGGREGLCIVADEQTAGRGRLQRAWLSPRDAGLYCSILLRPSLPAEKWPLITLMSAVVVHQTLHTTCGLETDIKWPNDILFAERKLCGILAETVDTPDGRALVVGIGINVGTGAFPPELRATATSIEAAIGTAPACSQILKELLLNFASRYEAFESAKSANEIIAAWSSHSSFAEGKRVRVTTGEAAFEGVTRGLEGDGALRVETVDGQLKVVRAGDVMGLRPTPAMTF